VSGVGRGGPAMITRDSRPPVRDAGESPTRVRETPCRVTAKRAYTSRPITRSGQSAISLHGLQLRSLFLPPDPGSGALERSGQDSGPIPGDAGARVRRGVRGREPRVFQRPISAPGRRGLASM
jgi:hypothetical protein